MDELPAKWHGQIIYHSGYKVKELYINKKYDIFKEEILNYKHTRIPTERLYSFVLIKAERYSQTEAIRRIKSGWDQEDPQQYGVRNHTPLGIKNLASIILYTDFTELSSDFTSTFHKQTPFETLSQIKERNRVFWWWSKTLSETVELFGENVDRNGPYYCGMSTVMTLPSLAIRLCSPTSTSIHLEVALKFSSSEGMIIQMMAEEVQSLNGRLRAFDCSFISR